MSDPEVRTRPAATPLYACADAIVLRAALAPRGPVPSSLPADTRGPEDPARLDALLRTFRGDPGLAAALELASPDLARLLTLPPGTAVRTAGDLRRTTLALTGYLLRLRHRATPFGLFAGSALTAAGPAGRDGLGSARRLVLRPAPQWLAGLVAELECDPGLPACAPRVRVAVVPGTRRIGALQVVRDERTGGPGRWRVRTAVRRTPLVDAALAVAAASDAAGEPGIGYAPLLGLLGAAAPAVAGEQLARLLAGLLSAGLLATDLAARPGDADPMGHLAGRLHGHRLAVPLRGLRQDLRAVESSPTAAGLRRLRARLAAVHRPGAALVADVLLETGLRLPRPVVDEVEHAASVAWTCAPPRPACEPAGLHRAVLDRYGLDRAVPLTELLDLTASLGLAGPSGPGGGPPAVDGPGESHTALDRLLTGLALDALDTGRTELRLERPLLRRLAGAAGAAGAGAALSSVDVFAQVVTADAQALERGDFLVVLGGHGGPGPAGSVAGRLAGPLGARAAGLARQPDEGGGGDALEAEVVFRPPDAAAADLAGETGWSAFRIDLTPHGARRSPRDIDLADLVVSADRDGLRLRSLRLGRAVRPVSYSALHPGRAGSVAALLLALGRYGTSPWRAWDWGAAGALPRLPRVRVGRAVLSPARWTLPPELAQAAGSGDDQRWRRAVDRWREAYDVPGTVLAGAFDRRLPLDLADPVHAALLRREVREHRLTAVTEVPGGLSAWRDAGWPAGTDGPHTAEFVLPLRPRTPRPAAAADAPTAPRAVQVEPGRVFPPGGEWLCAGLAVPAALQEGVLAELSDPALTAAGRRAGIDRWFFVRAADAAGTPQLRLRFHGRPQRLNAILLPALSEWFTRLRDAGLVHDMTVESYRPELTRYGGGACMQAAEEVFHRDARLVLELLAATPATQEAEATAAVAVLSLLTAMLGSQDVVGRLPEPRLTAAERRAFVRLRPAVRQCTPADDGRPPEAVVAHGRGAQSAWQDWHGALTAYRARLLGCGEDPQPVAWSLVHMFCNRLAGPDRPVERIAVALARDSALTGSTAVR
jgi:thiopeptide-type bacteriocin biosynthesis protein